jgi:hypothetical protein
LLHEDLAMTGKIKDDISTEDVSDDIEDVEAEDLGDTSVIAELSDIDDEDDISVEINVEELVAKLEATDEKDLARRREIHRRLEELEDRRKYSEDLDNTYNFNLDDEL